MPRIAIMLPCTYRSYNLSVRHLYTSSFAEHGKFAIHYFDNNPAENYVMIETEPYLVAHESSLDWPYFEHPASAVDDTSAYIYMIHGYGGIDTLYCIHLLTCPPRILQRRSV